MTQEVESWFVLRDGTKLFEKTWIPSTPPKAHLVYLHGFSDRCEIHQTLFPTLSSLSIQVHSFDQRGWGKSVLHPHQKGQTGPTSLVLSDIHEFVRHVASSTNNKPLFMMGHSMGGQELLCYILSKNPELLNDRPKLSGIVVEAPYIALDPSSEPSTLLVVVGKLAARVAPKWQMKQKLESKFITRDENVNRDWEADELCHDTGTLEGLRDMLQRASDLRALTTPSTLIPSLSSTLPVPTLWTHGTEDKITAFAPSKALFDRLIGPDPESVPAGVQGKTFRPYEGAYHKIHCEPDGVGSGFAGDVGTWILGVVGTGEREEGVRSKL